MFEADANLASALRIVEEVCNMTVRSDTTSRNQLDAPVDRVVPSCCLICARHNHLAGVSVVSIKPAKSCRQLIHEKRLLFERQQRLRIEKDLEQHLV